MITVEKLRMFCNDLKILGYEIHVPENVLFRQIMENFGAEQRIVRDVAKTLRQIGFMRPLGTGVWEYAGEFAPAAVVKEAIAADDTALADREVIE